MEKKKQRLSELDLLRFVAALAVVAYHRFDISAVPLPVYHGAQFGFLGVELFFMISGYVILLTAEKRGPYEFAASRISRLTPTFWVAMTLTLAILLWQDVPVTAKQVLANLTLMPQLFREQPLDTVYWTLNLEIKFYALVLVLIFLNQIRHIERYLAGWLAVSLIGIWVPKLAIVTLAGYAPYFAAGCLFYKLSKEVTTTRVVLLAASLALAVPHGIEMAYSNAPRFDTALKGFYAGTIVVLEFALMLTMALRWWQLPSWKGWTTLGAMTYPLYLAHYEVGKAIWNGMEGASPAAKETVSILVPLAIAWVLALTTERYACPWLNRFLIARKWGASSRSDSQKSGAAEAPRSTS